MGILTALRPILAWVSLIGLYCVGIVTAITSIFWRAERGLFLLVFLIPLPTIWYKLYDLPFGKNFLDTLFVAVFIGIFVNKKGLTRSKSSIIIMACIVASYISVWNSTINFSLPLPISAENRALILWKSYFFMLFMYFLTLNAIEDEKTQKLLIFLMVVVVLLMSIKSNRDFMAGSSFVDGSRDPGPFWIVGLGSNHFGAFISYCWSFVLGLALVDRDKKRRILYLVTLALCVHPLFFSYSRGAYAAAFGVLIFYGVMRNRYLLIAVLILVVVWEAVLPQSVVERIGMTGTESGELESSATARLGLWNEAMAMFREYPVFGSGFNGFTFSHWGEHWSDTHNFFLKTLCEQGIVGAVLMALLIVAALRSGWTLYRIGESEFQRGVGCGFLGCMVSHLIANMFGDRWSYYEMGSYFWVFWGLVDRGILISETGRQLKAGADKIIRRHPEIGTSTS